MRPEGIATSWRYIRVRLHRLTSIPALLVPALLVCCAVILNLGPFARAPLRQTVAAVAPLSNAESVAQRWVLPTTIGRSQADAALDVVPPNDEASVAPPPPAHDGARLPAESPPDAPEIQPVQLVTTPMPAAPIVEASAAREAERTTPAGIWAPNATACSLRDLRDGLLPTIIDTEGARAGDTFCTFKNRTAVESGWRVVASCIDGREHWTAVVRLIVKDEHLTWASSRGRQVYTRCTPDAVKTAAR
jgi:hypothetical protein